MKRNGRLSLALHTMSHMAHDPDRMQTSADIADHLGTNAVVVRRVLGKLRKAGLLISEKGHAGGWKLAKAPGGITLADVYLALDERLISTETDRQETSCAVESALRSKVADVMDDIERTLVQRLSETTLSDVHH